MREALNESNKKTPLNVIFSFILVISSALISSHSYAEPFMNKAQYADYSVRYQCAELQYHDNLEKKEQIIIKLEEEFGINDETFDAFDELIPELERDDDLLDRIRARVNKECS